VASLSPGDQVVCIIKAGVVLQATEVDYDLKQIFDIASQYENGYMIYVPVSLFLKDAIPVVAGNLAKFKIDKKFLGSSIYYITEYKIVYVYRKIDGICCSDCNEFYSMAVANQPNGTLICWNCRHYKHYK